SIYAGMLHDRGQAIAELRACQIAHVWTARGMACLNGQTYCRRLKLPAGTAQGGCRCRTGFRELDWGCEPKCVQALRPTRYVAHFCSNYGGGLALYPLWHG